MLSAISHSNKDNFRIDTIVMARHAERATVAMVAAEQSCSGATESEMAAKHWSGQTCPESGTYGQYHDTNNAYAGVSHDKYVKKGDTFPPSVNNYHFVLKS